MPLVSHFRIASFQEVISRGIRTYNCQFNLPKTSSNQDTGDQRSQARFLGAVLDISTREIFPNYSAYANTNLYFLQSWPKSNVRPREFISRLVPVTV